MKQQTKISLVLTILVILAGLILSVVFSKCPPSGAPTIQESREKKTV